MGRFLEKARGLRDQCLNILYALAQSPIEDLVYYFQSSMTTYSLLFPTERTASDRRLTITMLVLIPLQKLIPQIPEKIFDPSSLQITSAGLFRDFIRLNIFSLLLANKQVESYCGDKPSQNFLSLFPQQDSDTLRKSDLLQLTKSNDVHTFSQLKEAVISWDNTRVLLTDDALWGSIVNTFGFQAKDLILHMIEQHLAAILIILKKPNLDQFIDNIASAHSKSTIQHAQDSILFNKLPFTRLLVRIVRLAMRTYAKELQAFSIHYAVIHDPQINNQPPKVKEPALGIAPLFKIFLGRFLDLRDQDTLNTAAGVEQDAELSSIAPTL
jgi:hypothetical protein